MLWIFPFILLLASGCPPGAKESHIVETLPAPEWKDLISDVRIGESDEIRFTNAPVTIEQGNELKIACQKLRVLHFDQSNLNNDVLAEIFSLLPELDQLKLTGTVDNQQLETLGKYASQVKVLNLPNGQFDDIGLTSLSEFTNLNLLRFDSPHVTNQGIQSVSKLPKLKSLHLINVPITDDSLKTIETMESLQSFYLDGSQCTDEGLSELIQNRPELHFHRNQLHLQQDPNSHQH